MALKDLIRPAPTPAGERPPGITCEKYVRGEGKRCVHYVSNGACSLPDEFMCVEWIKANGPRPRDDAHSLAAASVPPKPAPQSQARDLFGNPVVSPEEKPKPTPATPEVAPPKQAAEAELSAPTIDVDQLRGFTTEDIESFRALGVEVQLQSGTYGDVWLVPAYTGKDRKEITPEHAATIARVMSVFPGSHIVSFEKTNPNKPERRERPVEERS